MIGLGPSVAEFSKHGHYCETILMAKVWYFGAKYVLLDETALYFRINHVLTYAVQ